MATALTAPILGLPEAREEFLRRVPVGRIGRPEDIARMVLFVAGEAADWITGQTLAGSR